MSRSIAHIVFLGVVFASTVSAEAPTLSDIQKLTLQLKYTQYENARLKLDAAQSDLLAYIKSLEKEGFTLDINTGTFTPIPEKP